jgi:hypothetical protein
MHPNFKVQVEHLVDEAKEMSPSAVHALQRLLDSCSGFPRTAALCHLRDRPSLAIQRTFDELFSNAAFCGRSSLMPQAFSADHFGARSTLAALMPRSRRQLLAKAAVAASRVGISLSFQLDLAFDLVR